VNENIETHEENVNDEIEDEEEITYDNEDELNDIVKGEINETEEINEENETIEIQKEITNPNDEEDNMLQENVSELFMTDGAHVQDERSTLESHDDNETTEFGDQRSVTSANDIEAERNEDVFDEYNPNVVNPNKINESVTMKRYNMRNNQKKVVDDVFNQKHYTFLNFYNHKNNGKQKDDYINGICNAMLRMNGNENCDYVELYGNAVGLCFTQMSARKGIKMFGEEALTALADEYAQLDSLSVFTPRNVTELTRKERWEALRTISS